MKPLNAVFFTILVMLVMIGISYLSISLLGPIMGTFVIIGIILSIVVFLVESDFIDK
jgi:hypothetical protein